MDYGRRNMIVKSISVQPLDVKKKQDGENPMMKGHNREENVPSLHQEWRHFKEETSLHGLKFATRNGKYRIRWLIWTLAFLASLGTLIYTLTGVFYDFMAKRTISNIAVKQVEELPFPAVTICPMSPYKRSHLNLTEDLERYYLSISRIGPHLGHIVIDYSDPIYQEQGNETFFNQASFQTSDIFYVCLFDNIQVQCDQLFEKKMTEMGLCFTMNSYDHVSKYGQRMTSQTGSTSSLTLYIMIDQDEYVYSKNVAAGYKVTIHDPEEEPNVMNMAFLTSPGFSVNAAIRMKKYSYLSYPYKAVGDKYCLETRDENFRNTLKYFPTYSEYGCTRECKRDYVVSKCGCRSHFDPGEEEICSLDKIANCYENYSNCFDSNSSIQSACDCRIPCKFNQFSAQISTALFPAEVYDPVLRLIGFDYLRDSYMELNVYFDSLTYLEVEQRPEYTPEGFIGLIGGQMGIFIGASLLTLLEVLEFIMILIVSPFYKLYFKFYGKDRT